MKLTPPKTDPNRCCVTVYDNMFRSQCQRKWKVERDGQRYCTQHDPVRIAEKKKAEDVAWRKKRNRETWEMERRNTINNAKKEIVDRVVRESECMAPGMDERLRVLGETIRIARAELATGCPESIINDPNPY